MPICRPDVNIKRFHPGFTTKGGESIIKISRSLQVLALSTLAFCVGAQAAERYDSGKREYMDRCAVCHGESGKGEGFHFGRTP